MAESNIIYRPDDARRAGYCVKGQREWAKRHNLDFRKWVREGLPEDVLLATGDHMAVRMIEIKRKS